jgi:Protein of unknown function (DUF4242)
VETFVVETYLSSHVEGEPEATIARVEAAAGAAATAGEPVRYVRSIFVPDDESCLLLIDAPSAEAVDRVAASAGLAPIRIASVWLSDGENPREDNQAEG